MKPDFDVPEDAPAFPLPAETPDELDRDHAIIEAVAGSCETCLKHVG